MNGVHASQGGGSSLDESRAIQSILKSYTRYPMCDMWVILEFPLVLKKMHSPQNIKTNEQGVRVHKKTTKDEWMHEAGQVEKEGLRKDTVNWEAHSCWRTWGQNLDLCVQFSAVSQSCPTLCDPMDCSTAGLPVHHQLPEFTQTHVHWIGDAILPSHPPSFPTLSSFNLSQDQGLFK